MTLPVCHCGAPAVVIAPGTASAYAPGGIVIDAGMPVRAWCAGHAPHLLARMGALGMASVRDRAP